MKIHGFPSQYSPNWHRGREMKTYASTHVPLFSTVVIWVTDQILFPFRFFFAVRVASTGCNEIIQTLILFCHIRSHPHLFDGRSGKAR